MIKIEIKTIYGNVLFEYEKKDNTIKDTLIEAVNKGADLRCADLRGADLRGAYLRGAYLRGAYLRGADLEGAYLRGADLRGADLEGADLEGAYLRGADLRGADLEVDKIKHLFQIFPEEGNFIAWKKLSNNCIAKLEIPNRAKKTSCFKSRKCRASFVKTLEIINNEGKNIKEGVDERTGKTIYKVGCLTPADEFNGDMREECTHGIHFFMSKQEALNW